MGISNITLRSWWKWWILFLMLIVFSLYQYWLYSKRTGQLGDCIKLELTALECKAFLEK